MSSASIAQAGKINIVDSDTTLVSFLDQCKNLPTEPPALYIDLEGIKLGRHGSISLVSIFISPLDKVYLIDVHTLGKSAFLTANSDGTTLKSVLESPILPKVIFDLRHDSDALFSHYQISVDGIKDLQLMELASRRVSRKYVFGLAKCIENHSGITSVEKLDWKITKDAGVRMFAPEKGGSYEVFNQRPLSPEIGKYCANDVILMPVLYRVYSAKLAAPNKATWRAKIQQATRDRIALSQSSVYNGKTQANALGPWGP